MVADCYYCCYCYYYYCCCYCCCCDYDYSDAADDDAMTIVDDDDDGGGDYVAPDARRVDVAAADDCACNLNVAIAKLLLVAGVVESSCC